MWSLWPIQISSSYLYWMQWLNAMTKIFWFCLHLRILSSSAEEIEKSLILMDYNCPLGIFSSSCKKVLSWMQRGLQVGQNQDFVYRPHIWGWRYIHLCMGKHLWKNLRIKRFAHPSLPLLWRGFVWVTPISANDRYVNEQIDSRRSAPLHLGFYQLHVLLAFFSFQNGLQTKTERFI